MAVDLPRWKIIQRDGIAIRTAAGCLRRIGGNGAREGACDLGSRKQGRQRGTSRPRHMAIAPDAVPPVDDLAVPIQIGFDLDRHRRTERGMGHLVRARPLHAHRTAAGRLRQQHGVERDIVGAVMAVAAGALDMFDHDILDRDFEHQREIGPQQIDTLTVGPDMDAIFLPLRHGA
jgi:hypothetical protein